MLHDTIAQEIIQLKAKDDFLRKALLQNGELSDGYHPEMEALHIKNAQKLEQIMEEIGYPTVTKVGERASEAAWVIIQHAISIPNFMRKSANLLMQAVEAKEADPVHLAYITDRIAVFEGKPQLYGTQFDWDEAGEMRPNKYDKLSLVNKRRQALGLNTLEEQVIEMQKSVKEEGLRPPKNVANRKVQYEEWRRKTGWIS